MRLDLRLGIIVGLIGLMMVSCSGRPSNDAAQAIEAYYRALISKNYSQLANLSCATWESQAKTDFNSFSAVSATLENPACQITGKDGDYTLVSCTGKIVASYGNEILEIDLSKQTYQVIQESGDWLMCGYH